MRTLLQPGPVHPRRIESFGATAQSLTFPLRVGATLLDAATEPLVAAGWRGGPGGRPPELRPSRFKSVSLCDARAARRCVARRIFFSAARAGRDHPDRTG